MANRTFLWIASAVSVGAAVGLAGYTFVFAHGASYLTNDPAACANCHVMRDQYEGWLKASHHSVAVCNDCHTPPGLIPKYTTKALNGFWHSFYFTVGGFHEPIQIGPRNREVTEKACRKCHGDVVDTLEPKHAGAEQLSCLTCHNSVGHPEGLGRPVLSTQRDPHD